MLLRKWNTFCTFALALSAVCVQCPVWLFSVIAWFLAFLICCLGIVWVILRWLIIIITIIIIVFIIIHFYSPAAVQLVLKTVPVSMTTLFSFTVLPTLSDNMVCINPYPTAFPYGNGMVLHFYQQQESSTTKTVHKFINKRLKTYVYSLHNGENFH